MSTEAAADARPPESKPAESLSDILSRLNAGRDGLSEQEAHGRLEKYGPNELPEKHVSPLVRFLGYFWGPIPWMIEAAVVLSAVVKDWTDFVIIGVLLFFNAGIGFWEEYQADNAVEALKKRLALNGRVKRDGRWRTVPARELVPGDVVRLRLGDIVPADAALLEGDPVQVDQSALTGESLPVTHETGDGVYSGSIIKQGEIDGVVTATGAKTYFGKTTGLVEAAHTVSHFQRAVLKIGDYLIVLDAVLVALIIMAALFRMEVGAGHDSILKVLKFALVLTVAAIPVAMPTVLSVTMAVGAKLLSAKQAIVRKLASVEEMAGIDVLCSDKTGTLTKNELTLGEPVVIPPATEEQAYLCGGLASREEDQDVIDLAVLRGMKDKEELANYKIEHFQPFDPVSKRTEATVRGPDGAQFRVSKGAPQIILSLCKDDPQVTEQVQKAIEEFASRGFRALGVARTDDGGDWRYVGVLGLYDPPRDDSRQTIETAKQMGLSVKMVTGDQTAIARETARQLGLGTNIVDVQMFKDMEHHMGGQHDDQVEAADGFAEVFPEHKYHIVEVLQKRGHIVAMTGDGVNDAPALKKADAGIAVSGATDAARAAAAIVLMAPGLSTIVDAIKESRRIFQRMNNYAIYRITETIRVLFFMTLCILVFNFYPVTAVMIVLLAVLNDGAILSIAYDNTLGSPKPEKWEMPRVLGTATILGCMGVVETFLLFYIGDRVLHLNRDVLQTLIYLKLSVSGHLTVFVARTRGPFWSSRPSSILLVAVLATQGLATLISAFGCRLMTPLSWELIGLVWAYALVWFLIEDRVKLFAYGMMDEHPVWLQRVHAHEKA